METYSNIEVKVGEILDVTSQDTSQDQTKYGGQRMDEDNEHGVETSKLCP